MTHEQIIEELVIGFFLILVGIVLQPLLTMIWKRMNKPSPLTAQTKGQLVTSLAMAEASLERLNYLDAHPRDLFLYLIQLVLTALFLAFVAIFLCGFRLLLYTRPLIDLFQLLVVILFAVAAIICLFGLAEGSRLSGKRIDATKQAVQKTIDEINRRLNPPA
jgi:hypothetical protein